LRTPFYSEHFNALLAVLKPSTQKGGEEMATFTAITFNLFETVGLVQPRIEIIGREPSSAKRFPRAGATEYGTKQRHR
jgi:hypothetical protein